MAEPEQTLDLVGIPCPHNSTRVLLALEDMDPGALLEVIADDNESTEKMLSSLAAEGYVIAARESTGTGRLRILVFRTPLDD